ncbi:MAG TPA: NAD(P)/FAD-dependent oxidoreductase [Armatimonadota bacterium]|nr:NAD(P)/FAD-dependent oxidoreductase [Armatimonadota bacterium]
MSLPDDLSTPHDPVEPQADNNQEDVFDVTLVGGGPVGMFGMFYAGIRDMKCKIIDALPELGGQLAALYPEKFIFDVLGFPKVLARDLVASCKEQATQWGGTVCLDERVEQLHRRSDGVFELVTPKTTHYSRTVILTSGVGAFSPVKLNVPGVDRFENNGVVYFVSDKSKFAGKRILIVGGGDSAVDWALNLQDVAADVTLIHRRDKFRAHEGSVNEMMATRTKVLLWHEAKEVHGNDHIEGVTVFENRTKEEQFIPCDIVLLTLGFKASLGPIRDWGLNIEGGSIVVNDFMETNIPGVYSAGDIVTFPGKLKLIATGAGEVTVAICHAKHYIDPSVSIFPGHSSNRMGG